MNKVLTFLSNFGQMVLRGLNVLPQVTQVLESSSGRPIPVLDKLSQIGGLVKSVEVIADKLVGPGAGQRKAEAIAPLVAQVLYTSELVAGMEMLPGTEAEFNAVCVSFASDTARLLNCFKPKTIEIPVEKATPTPAPTAVLVPAKPAAAPAPNVTAAPAPPLPFGPPAPAPVPTAAEKLRDNATYQATVEQIPDAPATAAAIAAGLDIPQD